MSSRGTAYKATRHVDGAVLFVFVFGGFILFCSILFETGFNVPQAHLELSV